MISYVAFVLSLFVPHLSFLWASGGGGGGRGGGGGLCFLVVAFLGIFAFKGNPLYTDTQYNDKNRYNDNVTVMKHSLKR